MRIILSTFCYAALFLLMEVSIISAAEPSPLPTRFMARIGGFLNGSYQVELQDDTLTYTKFGGGRTNPKRAIVKPDAAQWREFRRTLDELKIWQWRGDYPNNGTMDGTQWSLDLAFADHAIKTHGNNSYPDATGQPNGKPETTETFRRYLDAIKELTGGKTFQ